MGRRKGRSNKRPPATVVLARIERELSKGNAKGALKDAKTCFRGDPTPDCRNMLERAYLGRIEQLHRMQMAAEARSVLAELLDFKPSNPEVQAQLGRLRLLVGDAGANAAEMFQSDPALLIEVADRSVLDPRVEPPDYGELRAQLSGVREALAAVERGDDEAAAAAVREIPRSSPLCDWKLFVRGLSAFYQANSERTQENWRRLDADRPAWRIAQTLLAAAGEPPSDGRQEPSAAVVNGLGRLERRWRSDPVAKALSRLSELWQADLDEFFREYRSFRQRYAKSQTAVVEAIVDIVWKRAIREGSNWMLERVIQIGPAPPLDPHWNRARALLAEHPEEFHGDRVEKYWAAYAEDAANLQCLRPDERPVASALASLHLARQCIRFLDQWEPGPFTTRGDDEEVDRLHDVAAHFLRLAIQRCPQLLDAYRMLARLHEDDGELPKAAVVQKRLLAQSPDDYDAHLWLAHHYLECNDPGSSEPHVEAVFRLKPRDKRTESLRWNQRVTMIRALALKRQFEAARRELEALSQHVPTGTEPYTLHLLRAAIELKAKNEAAAGSAIDDALATVEEPTAIWAQLASIAARYKLPADLRKAYTNRFKQAVAGKTTSQTAGRLARLLLGFRSSQVNFTGRVTQERLLVKYLKRTGHVHWQAGDLLDVCKFLKLFPKESRQLETLLAKGAKRFPDDPFFHLWLARLEMERGPYECNLAKAQRSAQRALDAARAAASPDREIIEEAEGIVSAIEDMPSFLRNPFMADPEMFMPMFGDTYEDEDDYEDDEDDEGGFDFLPPLDFDENIAYEKLKEMAPRSIIAQLEQMALEYGMEPAQLFREMIANGPPENFGSGFETPPASDRRRGSAAKAKRRKR